MKAGPTAAAEALPPALLGAPAGPASGTATTCRDPWRQLKNCYCKPPGSPWRPTAVVSLSPHLLHSCLATARSQLNSGPPEALSGQMRFRL